MGSWSIGHWLIVLIIVLLLFGAGKVPKLMGDMAKGVKAFKQGLKDDDEPSSTQPQASIKDDGVIKSAETHDVAAKH